MIENTLEVGPFTPQELEHVCDSLKSRQVSFEILKDEETEKAQMKNDYSNLVKKAEYRLETYLGQIFYLKIRQLDFKTNKILFESYGMATHPSENPQELEGDLMEVHEEGIEQKRLQRILAISLLALAASVWLWTVFS